jgi:hypothetical protein
MGVGGIGFTVNARGYYDSLGRTAELAVSPGAQGTTPWVGAPCVKPSDCDATIADTTPGVCINNQCFDFVGDYAWGAFFVRPPDLSTPRFLVPWQHTASSVDPRTYDQITFREVSW